MLLEIACFTPEDAIAAQKAGADRIELCEDYSMGGITPNENDIIFVRGNLQIDLYVMIRPRGGNFIYTDEEFEKMKKQILLCKKLKCDGVVFGILTGQNKVNKKQCSELVSLSKPMQCTFHRAFDETEYLEQSLEDIIAFGFSRVLTSCGKGNAADNLSVLKKLIDIAKKKITIMPGGGVRSSNISEILNETKAKEIHSAAIDKNTLKINTEEIIRLKEKLLH